MSTFRSIWTRYGSEKAQSSQIIRTLINTLLGIAQEAVQEGTEAKNRFIVVVARNFREYFKPDITVNINEQIQTFLLTLGWKNSEIRVVSANEARAILGNNRFIVEENYPEETISLLISAIFTGIGYYIFSKEIKVQTDFDELQGAVWSVKMTPTTADVLGTSTSTSKTTPQQKAPQEKVSAPAKNSEISMVSVSEGELQKYLDSIDPEQFVTPIFKRSLGVETLLKILAEVMLEFSRTKYESNPLEALGSIDNRTMVLALTKFLVEKTFAENLPTLERGREIGVLFGKGVKGVLGDDPNQLLVEEITDAPSTTIIRDIKARAFCFLKPGERCQPSNVQICDFVMGIWEGTLKEILGKEFKFSNRYPATKKKDMYCLMELTTTD